jgi:hypothetical protein
MAKLLAILAAVGIVGGVQALSADSASAQLTVGVTVLRSCAVDARAAENDAPTLRLTCTAGAQSSVKLSESIQQPAEPMSAGSGGLQIITLNF